MREFTLTKWAAGHWLAPVLLGTLVGACQPEPGRQLGQGAENKQPTPTKKLAAQLADSLRKYRHLTDFLQEDDSSGYVLYGKLLNGQPVGVAAITDSVLLVFQQRGRRYVLTARCRFPEDATASDFNITDLNGDDKDDVILYGFPNMHGQRRPYVFLSDSTGLLHYRPDLALYNIAYSRRKKLLVSFYVGGVTSVHSKEVYRWQGDSARLVAGAEYDMNGGGLEVYRMRDSRKCHRKLYPAAPPDAAGNRRNEAVYDTVLFDIGNFYK